MRPFDIKKMQYDNRVFNKRALSFDESRMEIQICARAHANLNRRHAVVRSYLLEVAEEKKDLGYPVLCPL